MAKGKKFEVMVEKGTFKGEEAILVKIGEEINSVFFTKVSPYCQLVDFYHHLQYLHNMGYIIRFPYL